MKSEMQGKVVMVTGASQGLGFVIAKTFLMKGATIAICARNKEELNNAVKILNSFTPTSTSSSIFSKIVDVSNRASFSNFVKETIQLFSNIHVLINNAGIYGPKGNLSDVSLVEWKRAIAINFYSVVYGIQSVLPGMIKQGGGKIINLSGGGATSPLPGISSYAASKTAVVALTEEVARLYRPYKIDINAIAPGALNTRLLDEILESGAQSVGQTFYEKAKKQKSGGGDSLERAANLCLYLASNKSDGISGKLISAVWDKWEELHLHGHELMESDIYNLRKIFPEDRSAFHQA